MQQYFNAELQICGARLEWGKVRGLTIGFLGQVKAVSKDAEWYKMLALHGGHPLGRLREVHNVIEEFHKIIRYEPQNLNRSKVSL